MNKFLIIDGNSILNRAFYGVNARMTSKTAGIHTNAIYGFLNIFWMIKEKFNPEYIAVSFDLAAPTFRHKMYSEYKGTRKGMPDELREQLPVIKEVLNAMNIPIIEKEGYEADDVLGTVSNLNSKNNIFTYILTGDRDSFQLIADDVHVILPKSGMGKTEYKIYDIDLLKEEYGILPYQVIETKSLMGDASDNIPGVKGVGEKTAYSLVQKYETLDNVYRAIEENTIDISDKIKEKLLLDKSNAYLSKTLATIIIDADIIIDYEKCKVSDINYEKTYALFKKLEFEKFLSKFDFSKVNKDLNVSYDKEENNNYLEFNSSKNILILNKSNINDNINKIYSVFNNENISYIYNNPNLSYFSKNTCLNKEILSIYNIKNDETIIIDLEDILNYSEELYQNIIMSFLNSSSLKFGYNMKQDIRYFLKFTNNIKNFNFDIMIAYYLLDSTRQDYLIEYILNDLFGIILKKENENKNSDVQLNLFDEITLNKEDTKNILSSTDISNISDLVKGIYIAKDYIIEKLNKENMTSLFNDIEMPLLVTLADMEYTGMHVDKQTIDKFNKEISTRIEELISKIYLIAGEEFNINSTKQLGIILFEKLLLKGGRKTKTGYSTDKEVLEGLVNEHEIIPYLLEYRTLAKLKSTYVDGLLAKIDSDNRIHTTFMQTVASTGRLSSIEPNLQNIPIRTELGGKIRTFFTSTNNDTVIIDADYSQIELRMFADISSDSKMIDAFNKNIDIHTSTASEVFGVDIKDVTSELRRKAKAVNFGIVYGISEYGLAKNIGVESKEAKKYINEYLAKYSGIAKFMEDIVSVAKKDGYVTTIFNRRRYIKELTSKNKNVVKFGERIAMNTPIQGSAADIIKLAMNRIYQKLKLNNLQAKLIMQVHDELLIECPKSEIEIASDILREEMQNVVKLKVPLIVDLNVANNWYEAK